MVKLASPVQYESPLEGLNDVRPLQLADVGKIVLPTPVLCKNLPTVNKPAVGRLVRCTQQGALLRDNSEFADKVKSARLDIMDYRIPKKYTFPMKVYGVIAKYFIQMHSFEIVWCSPDGANEYIALSVTDYLFLPFVGTDIWFMSVGENAGFGYIAIKGFYK